MIQLITNWPVAIDSLDCQFPYGAKLNNTQSEPWWIEVEQMFGRKISYLDLGCAGGGLVYQGLQRGHFAVGLEGCDYWSSRLDEDNPIARQWKECHGENLFFCDISRPFQICNVQTDRVEIQRFDLITAWEVFEHIPVERIDTVLQNIHEHLSDHGFFVGTVNIGNETSSGREMHVNIRPIAEWYKHFSKYFIVEEYPFNEKVRYDNSFHVKLRKR